MQSKDNKPISVEIERCEINYTKILTEVFYKSLLSKEDRKKFAQLVYEIKNQGKVIEILTQKSFYFIL